LVLGLFDPLYSLAEQARAIFYEHRIKTKIKGKVFVGMSRRRQGYGGKPAASKHQSCFYWNVWRR